MIEGCNYKESLCYIKDLKRRYEGILSSFCIYGGNKEVFEQAYKIKRQVYSVKVSEKDYWKKDKLWEYLNNDIEYLELWKFI